MDISLISPKWQVLAYVGLCIYNLDLGLILVLKEICLQIILTKCQYSSQSDVSLSLAAGDSGHTWGDGQELHGGHLLLLRAPGNIMITWSWLNSDYQEDDLARVMDNGTCSVAHHAEYCRDTAWCVKTWRGNTSDNMTGERWHQLMGWHLDCVWGEESHLQTDWASYCETRAFRFWDWTVTLARLILSLPMWTWHTQPVNGAIVDCRQTNIPIGQSVKT